MMTHSQLNGHTTAPDHSAIVFSYDRDVISSPETRDAKTCFLKPMIKSVAHSPQGPALSDPQGDDMNLRPSVAKIKSSMKTDFTWKKQVEKALGFRSFFISAAMVGMIAVGIMLVV